MFKGVRINNSFRDRFHLSWRSKLRYDDYKWHTQRCWMDQNNKSTKSIHSSILEQVISKQVKITTFNFQCVLNLSVTTSLRQRCLFICGKAASTM